MSEREISALPLDAKIAVANRFLRDARWPRLTVNEMRLVLHMLALIDKADQDFKRYRISVKELQLLLGIKHKNMYREFDKATDGLLSKIIKWVDPIEKDARLKKTTWCSYASLPERKGYVELSFDPSLKEFLLLLKTKFTLYELRAVIRLKNHFHLRLYMLMKYHQGYYHTNHFEINLDDLKAYLDIGPKEYKLYGHLKSRVLVPAIKDLEKHTDIKLQFEPIKAGRKIVALSFSWEHNPRYDQLPLFSPDVLASEEDEKEEKADFTENGRRLKALGFIDWKKVCSQYPAQILTAGLDNAEWEAKERKKRNDGDFNPGGWLRSALKNSEEKFVFSTAYQKHLEEQDTKRRIQERQRTEARARAAEEKRHEKEREDYEAREAKIQGLPSSELVALEQEARERAVINDLTHEQRTNC